MKHNPISIIADSCCDVADGLRGRLVGIAPLTITIEGKEYVDDGTVDMVPYLAAMKTSRNPARSACPSPERYAQEILSAPGDCFIVTLSSRLSGSYNAAVLGREMAMEVRPDKRVHVLDSESACAGETYLALLLRDLIAAGRSFEEIKTAMQEKIRVLHTVFVLDSLNNLVKNGRMKKVAAVMANLLSIRPVLSDDGEGGIRLLSKARGIRAALSQMADVCRKHTEGLAERSQRLTLSYCNCLPRAQQVRDMIWERCPAIGEIVMTETSALSSMYAEDGGIVIAY